MSGIDVVDYHAGSEMDLVDPTDPHEKVERQFMDRVAKTLTRMEEVLLAGDADMSLSDLSKFLEARGEALDMLDDPEISGWLDHMRQMQRCPFRKFAVRD